jgi:anti-sigma-K factor RskA
MNERLEDLLPFYALGTLAPAERAEVEAYVAANPDARARLEEMMRDSSALAQSIEPVDPPPALKKSLMDRINADARPRRPAFNLSQLFAAFWPRTGTHLSPAIALLSLVLLIAVTGWAIVLNDEVARLREETAALRRELNDQRKMLAQIAAPGARLINLSGTEHQPDAHGQFIARADGSSAVLTVTGLAPLEPGQVYQLWLVRGDTPVSAGLFEVDEDGWAVLQVTADVSPGSFDAIGVSIEPEGGSELPTGDRVMLGSAS